MKKLEYAYPTSPLAVKYAGGKGCWLVSGHGVAGFRDPAVFCAEDDKERALAFLEASTEPLDPYSFTRENVAPIK